MSFTENINVSTNNSGNGEFNSCRRNCTRNEKNTQMTKNYQPSTGMLSTESTAKLIISTDTLRLWAWVVRGSNRHFFWGRPRFFRGVEELLRFVDSRLAESSVASGRFLGRPRFLLGVGATDSGFIFPKSSRLTETLFLLMYNSKIRVDRQYEYNVTAGRQLTIHLLN